MKTLKLFFKSLIQGFLRHNIMYLASIIAYFGIASTIPLTLLLIFVTSLIVPGAVVDSFLERLFQTFIPSLPNGHTFVHMTISHLTRYRTAIGVLGVGGLLWSTIGGFLSLQTTLDTICEVHKRRSFIKQYVIGFAMVGILLLLVLLSSVITGFSPQFVSRLVDVTGLGWMRVVHAVSWIFLLFVLFATCFVCYRLLPSVVLSTPALLTGATVVTACVYVVRELFVVYTHHLGNYQLIYGALTFTTLFTFWLYIVSVLFLLGMEISVSVDRMRDLRSNSTASSGSLGKPTNLNRRVKRGSLG